MQNITLNEKVSNIQPWIILLIGLFALYVPTFFHLLQTVWSSEDQAHGPLVFFIVLYLFWIQKDKYLAAKVSPRPILGWAIFLFSLLVYVLGRSQDIGFFELGSMIAVISSIILITRGVYALLAVWFPLFFIIFMLPLPGSFVAAITMPMKIAVSIVAEQILYWLDYPIARVGVMLQIGQYQLLVADACAGLHTLLSLEGLGLLYLNLVKHDSFVRNVTLSALIVPISFIANVTRVVILILITYYFGDEAGQGFVHKFAGLVLFVVALTLVMTCDSLLQNFVNRRAAKLGKVKSSEV